MGQLLNIAIRDGSRAPMQERQEAEISTESGIQDDYKGTRDGRQVTILEKSAWETTCQELGADLPWTTRRANLLVEGVNLQDTLGAQIQIGDVLLEVTEETLPCGRMDELHQGLRDALTPDWRGGVSCVVVKGANVRIGDAVQLLTSTTQPR